MYDRIKKQNIFHMKQINIFYMAKDLRVTKNVLKNAQKVVDRTLETFSKQ